MLIDTHAHLNFNAFEKDADEVIRRSLDTEIWMINVGSNYETSKKAVEIAEKYPEGIFASIGLHPINLDTGLVKIKVDESEGENFEKDYNPPTTRGAQTKVWEGGGRVGVPAFGWAPFDFEKYKELARSEKIVAIGEIGLDYYWKPKTKTKLELFKQKQKDLFLKELKLAEELNLPVIFHCRMAHEDLIEILNYKLKTINYKLKGVMHGFVGTTKQLENYLKMDFYIGFNGIIFKKIEGINFEENIKNTPLEKILIETDCPYLAPPQFPEERNNPLGVKYVAEKIAKIKNISFEKIAEITTENAKTLFKL